MIVKLSGTIWSAGVVRCDDNGDPPESSLSHSNHVAARMALAMIAGFTDCCYGAQKSIRTWNVCVTE
jgi:hypothetical protein